MLRPAAFKARKKNAPRPEWKVATAYLQWLRGRPCYLEGHRCGGCGDAEPPRHTPVEAAHVDHGGDKGMQTKASDRFAIPLCQRHHDEQHGKVGSFSQRGGWKSFELKYGFDARKVADAYWKAWPGRRAWEENQ
ncbi:DUF968 domain-containing protein [Sphingobium sp. HDIP04]|uniref:DUF968 domain-containing protein n=1 Tax=Sphingobium sp. HDIP04 TaxID=428994 RepID=UPI000387693A|nr:DUF968 domain-containing protein [Sphingobium sp. HDIP04]EQA97316.1 hypothetical protein L286_23615 [Sphingobium sp. HDIP04]